VPDGLYERDILVWSERHGDLLRRIAAGERVNEDVDWPNVIEEVQDVGLSELRACNSLLRQAMLHMLKLQAWPGSQAAMHWHDEIGAFLADAGDRFTPSTRQRISLPDQYAKALHLARTASDDTGKPRPLPDTCPYALDDLLASNPDVEALTARLGAGPSDTP